jgi:two-component system phosphate regulon response regulator OmpR
MVNMPPTHIVVVDDDPKVRTLLRRAFEPEGFQVSEASGGDTLLALLRSQQIDLITLDLTLRNEDGLDIARRIRAESLVPIIMVTGKGDMIDRVVGLELGADDYISKPFHIRELLARVRTVLRRARSQPGATHRAAPAEKKAVYLFAGWRLDVPKRELTTPEGALCPLTTAEFDLLALFVQRPNRVLSRDQIMELLKGHNWAAHDRVVDTQVARLRKKLTGGSCPSSVIKTVRGAGYSFTADVS